LVLATAQLAVRKAVRDEHDADDEEEHGHDRAVVVDEPVLEPVEPRLRLFAPDQVVADGPGDGEAGDDDERDERHHCVFRRDAELRERDCGADREDEVLRIHGRAEQEAESEGFPGREGVDRGRPPRQLGRHARRRSPTPGVQRAEQEQDAKPDVEPRDAIGGRLDARDVERVPDRVDHTPHDREPRRPAQEERRSVHPGAAREEQQDDGDDGNGTDRDADRIRQDLADRVAHAVILYRRGRAQHGSACTIVWQARKPGVPDPRDRLALALEADLAAREVTAAGQRLTALDLDRVAVVGTDERLRDGRDAVSPRSISIASRAPGSRSRIV
jgi:hypothetical protein